MTIKGTSRFNYPGDLQHTGCLGVVGYFLGGVLYELVYESPLSDRPQEALKQLWDENRLTNLVNKSFFLHLVDGLFWRPKQLKAKLFFLFYLLFVTACTMGAITMSIVFGVWMLCVRCTRLSKTEGNFYQVLKLTGFWTLLTNTCCIQIGSFIVLRKGVFLHIRSWRNTTCYGILRIKLGGSIHLLPGATSLNRLWAILYLQRRRAWLGRTWRLWATKFWRNICRCWRCIFG